MEPDAQPLQEHVRPLGVGAASSLQALFAFTLIHTGLKEELSEACARVPCRNLQARQESILA